MFDFAGEHQNAVNFIFLFVTGFIAIKAIRTKKPRRGV